VGWLPVVRPDATDLLVADTMPQLSRGDEGVLVTRAVGVCSDTGVCTDTSLMAE
jgi:hypothetical protein